MLDLVLRVARATATMLAVTGPVVTSAATPAIAQNGGQVVSDIASDERVELYTTSGRPSADGIVWFVPIHGRVYRPVRSTARKSIISAVLANTFGVVPDRDNRSRHDDMIDMLLADNIGGRSVAVTVGGQPHKLPPSAPDGHFRGMLEIPTAHIASAVRDGRIEVSVRLTPRDPRAFAGRVPLLPSSGRSVISDIDDTVKITGVTSTKRMLETTFLRPFEAVPGMARVFQTWAAEGATFHFVSSTPWHFYEPLATFLKEAGFPDATITLKQIRLKDSSIQNVFADATKSKPPAIEALIKAYPGRSFVLVGDSGEKDPEIYGDFMRRFPDRIEKAFIRNVTGANREDARIAAAFKGVDAARWQLFVDAAELPHLLRR